MNDRKNIKRILDFNRKDELRIVHIDLNKVSAIEYENKKINNKGYEFTIYIHTTGGKYCRHFETEEEAKSFHDEILDDWEKS